MQTTTTAGHPTRHDAHLTARLSDRFSQIVAQGWLAEGIILLGVAVMLVSLVR